MLYAAQYSTDGNYIAAGGSGLNEAKLFDVKNHYKVCVFVYEHATFMTIELGVPSLTDIVCVFLLCFSQLIK